ncbi:hypothetical protein ACJJAK_12335, partial [Staphylococcus equorum]|uniref:hypothetical protein n=1 Tax=Staphylococcus equorum TaxID=246432 RepID=UPI0040400F74
MTISLYNLTDDSKKVSGTAENNILIHEKTLPYKESVLNVSNLKYVLITNIFNFKDFIYFLFVCIITDKIMVKINI